MYNKELRANARKLIRDICLETDLVKGANKCEELKRAAKEIVDSENKGLIKEE